MNRRTKIVWLALLLLRPILSFPDEPPADDAARERAARLELMRSVLSEYELVGGQKNETLQLIETPVLRFTNPQRRTADGGMFLWKLHGRPMAITCIYPVGDGYWDHEFQSLSETPLAATRNGVAVWKPRAGLQFKPVPMVPPPSDKAVTRRREMGEISRRFAARLNGWEIDRRNHDELRLQDAPVHRWSSDDGQIIDGAMYLFGEATDPEVALLLEAQRENDQIVWKYALARVTSGELEVHLDRELVWKMPEWHRVVRADEPYVTFLGQPAPRAR